jgi:hypothetical protein
MGEPVRLEGWHVAVLLVALVLVAVVVVAVVFIARWILRVAKGRTDGEGSGSP